MRYETPAINVTPLKDVLDISDGGFIVLPEDSFPEEE
jgi:hypothetical protein